MLRFSFSAKIGTPQDPVGDYGPCSLASSTGARGIFFFWGKRDFGFALLFETRRKMVCPWGTTSTAVFFYSSFFCQLRRRQELEGIRIVLLRLLASPCSNSKFYSNYRVFALHGDFFEKLDSNSFSGRTRLKTSRASASFL